MRKYYKDVDTRSRKAMVDFLVGHFRYYTMNSWNLNTSYANNIKIHSLGLPRDLEDKFYDALDTEEFHDIIGDYIDNFTYQYNGEWQIGQNGRSGGYLVLYSGGRKESQYKSYCAQCGQRNFKTVEETGNCKCGKCGADARKDYTMKLYEYFTSSKSVDSADPEDFEDWTMDELKRRVSVVQNFDRLCDDLLTELIDLVSNTEIVEEIIYVPKQVKALKPKTA